MSPRPDIATALDPGETLLWQGHPKKGRPMTSRAGTTGALLFLGAVVLLLLAGFLEIRFGYQPAVHLSIYGIIGTAAFLTYLGLHVTLLRRRRARARDARTAYGITNRRIVVRAGPYTADLPLGPEVRAEVAGGGLDITAPGTTLRLDRLDDADAAREILMAQIGGPA